MTCTTIRVTSGEARMVGTRGAVAILLALALLACSNGPADCKARTGDGICVDDIANAAATE